MNLIKSLSLGMMAFAMSATASAQTVDEVVAKHIDAIGGKDNWKKVNTMKMEATTTTQEIKTTVEGLTIDERDPNRIAATVPLRYANRRLDAAGQPVGASSALELTNRYVFGRGADGIWRVVSFRKA